MPSISLMIPLAYLRTPFVTSGLPRCIESTHCTRHRPCLGHAFSACSCIYIVQSPSSSSTYSSTYCNYPSTQHAKVSLSLCFFPLSLLDVTIEWKWCRDRYISRLVSTLPPTSEPSLLGPSLSRASYHIPPIPDYISLFGTIPVSSGNYFSCLNIHFPLSHTLFLSNIAVVIRPYSRLHPLSSSYH